MGNISSWDKKTENLYTLKLLVGKTKRVMLPKEIKDGDLIELYCYKQIVQKQELKIVD